MFAKRVAGTPGDLIELRENRLYRNGVAVDEPYIQILRGRALADDGFGPFVVPDDSVFVLGDNRRNSRDSRFFGSIPRELIRGRIEFRYFAIDGDVRWDRFPETLVPNRAALSLQASLN